MYRPYLTAMVARLAGNEVGAKVVISDDELSRLAGHLRVTHLQRDGEQYTELEIIEGAWEHRILWQTNK